MSRWLVLLIISSFVFTGASGCILVVGDDEVAHEVRIEKHRSRLARDIGEELDEDDYLRYSDISVTEDDGVVTLYGEVDSVDSLQYAMNLVARYAGVESVVSRLELKLDLD